MKRSLSMAVLGLVLTIALLPMVSSAQMKYKEAPMLAELVRAGKLPPVEQRLPKEPLVIEPIEKIGKYGGTLMTGAVEPRTWGNDGGAHIRIPYLLWVNREFTKVIPYLAKGYDFSKDMKTFTLYLREGMKWSDGYPFTVDDILFWWEDQILNDELTPVKPAYWKPGGELAKFKKVDDYTLKIEFAVPYRPALSLLAYFGSMQQNFFNPKHYLKRWHIKYNPDAGKLAKEEKFEFWYQAFMFHRDITPSQEDVNLPTVHPWMLERRAIDRAVYVRNPYYAAVDTAGNQLPYIDRIIVDAMDKEVMLMKIMNGDVDYAGMMLELPNYPVLMQNKEKGGYEVYMWPSPVPAEIALGFNLTHKDPVKRQVFQDVRFRRAMSLAIDRNEINEIVFLGQGVPMQATVHPSCSFFKEEWAKSYADYDPKGAEKLLDEMGLKRGPDGYRLGPDGKTLIVTIEYNATLAFARETIELVRSHWDKVGIKVAVKEDERTLYMKRRDANELDVGVWHTDRMMEFRVNIPRFTKYNPRSEVGWAVDWGLWLDTGGKSGEKPTGPTGEEFMDFMTSMDKWYSATSDEEYMALARRIWDNQARNLWIIGTVGLPKRPIVAQKYIKNFPDKCFWGDDTSWWLSADGTQWYLEK
ncbi:MAG: ABC transporter substrate-binding protein [bacterium]